MLLNTTYHNEEHEKTIAKLIGGPYSFFKSLKLRGVGSKRMIIDKTSYNLNSLLNRTSDLNYANIEIRPKGIIIYINKGLQTFNWVIPFYQLSFFKTNGASIHAQGKFIHLKDNMTLRENKKFFKKLLVFKIEYDNQYKFQF